MTCRYAPIPLLFSLAMCTPARGSTPDDAPRPVAQQDTARPSEPTFKPVKDSAARAPVLKAPEPAATAAAPVQPFTSDLEKLWKSRLSSRIKREPWKTTQRYEAAALLMVPLHAAFERGYARPARVRRPRHPVPRLPRQRRSRGRRTAELAAVLLSPQPLQRPGCRPGRLPHGSPGAGIPAVSLGATALARGPGLAMVSRAVPGRGPGTAGLEALRETRPQEEILRARHSGSGADAVRHCGRPAALRPDRRFAAGESSGAGGDRALRAPGLRQPGRLERGQRLDLPAAIWRDHPDHSGDECREEKRPGLAPCTTVAGAEDASHGHRIPLLLRSLAEAEPAGSAERAYYERLQWGLERQFFTRIAVPPSGSSPGGGSATTWTDGTACTVGGMPRSGATRASVPMSCRGF